MAGDTSTSGIAWRRFEAKYLVHARIAEQLVRFCRENLLVDRYAARCPAFQYPVQSIYLDSPGRHMLRSAADGHEDRIKLRVRSYRRLCEAGRSLPEFYEVKRKVQGVILKSRAMLAPVDGHSPTLAWTHGALTPGTAWMTEARCPQLDRFLTLRQSLCALPAIGVFYLREAYEDGCAAGVRISFDRGLHYGIINDGPILWRELRLPGVVFELKFTNTFPFWLQDLLHESRLVRVGVCKFAMCCRAALGRPAMIQL